MFVRVSLSTVEAVKAILQDKENEVDVYIQNKALKHFLSEECEKRIVNKLRPLIEEKAEKIMFDVIQDGFCVNRLSNRMQEEIRRCIQRMVDEVFAAKKEEIKTHIACSIDSIKDLTEEQIKLRVQKASDEITNYKIKKAIDEKLKDYFKG